VFVRKFGALSFLFENNDIVGTLPTPASLNVTLI